MENLETIRIRENEDSMRLDQYLSSHFKEMSRSYIKKLIDSGNVRLNGEIPKSSVKTSPGDLITVDIPKAEDYRVEPQDLPLDIVYQDKDIVVVNKDKGMVVHPGHGNPSGTLVNALLHQIKDLSGINGVKRPGIVHRIDKDTSGLLLVAKNDAAHKKLAALLKKHDIRRNYYAILEGVIQEENGKIDAPIGRDPKNRIKMAVVNQNSKSAVTHFKVIERFPKHTLIEASLETGRTHQIRVHMAYIGHPLVGDGVYGFKKQVLTKEGQALHAFRLAFDHPSTGDAMIFETPIPDYFIKIINKIKK
ncbi:RluA family pseudouridine synthase [Alkalibacter saccharofermentans]|uniref:Pseudouridine synthase n=1 Tax=Alkalibacter saccharofermentans DSM 14828 TaxID=1120975 RepID=A0A1M4S4Q6_9FIRM|nr:RluA family pseudouridine synthase [Alkalibacter saccharofermentans]SHE27181.1 23S rRNA pseudouridine1911/1915/1917 synthase [Alkalibacter saccharofermentans DSM 14828]